MYELAVLRDSFNFNPESEVEMQEQEVDFSNISQKGSDPSSRTETMENLLEQGHEQYNKRS